MKKTLLPLACAFVLALNVFPLSLQVQTPWDHNEGLLITEGATGDTVILSWWGRTDHFYEIEVSEDLLQWNRLPEVIVGLGEPIARELQISHNRWFMRVQISHLIADLFSENPNLKLLPGTVEYIGTEDMRGTFSGGGADSLPIDSGWVFSTGKAEDWNNTESRQQEQLWKPGDLDLEHWMRTQGFFWRRPNPGPLSNYETRDASGITFDFEVDPSVALGKLEMAFFFASEEYEIDENEEPKNDGMAIFVSEIDSNGDVIPGTRANIGVLSETETHSRAISVMNAGTVFHEEQANTSISVNVQESEFKPNSANQPPNSFGYVGFTGRLMASGGALEVYGDVSVTTRMRQMNALGLGASGNSPHAEKGWGGVMLRGRHDSDHKFSGYVVAFGLTQGDAMFTLYRIEEHVTFGRGTSIFPNENEDAFPSDTVEVLESIQVGEFDEHFEFAEAEWYWIRAEVDGNNVRARFWEGAEGDEPESWAIDVTDQNDALGAGFVGLIQLDTSAYYLLQGEDPWISKSDLEWDFFEIDDGSVYSTDFGEYQPAKRIPAGWETLGIGAREWEIKEDSGGVAGAIGGKYLQHDLEGENVVSILRYKGPGMVEGGKRYRVKAVVADSDDPDWDSALFLENGSVGIVTVSE